MSDPIRNVGGRTIGQYRDRAEVLDALQRGDAPISEILAKLPPTVNRSDIENYLRNQHRGLLEMENEQPAYSASGDMPPPPAMAELLPDFQDDQALDEEDRAVLMDAMHAMVSSQVSKSARLTKDAQNPDAPVADPNAPLSPDELAGMAEGTLGELQSTMAAVSGEIERRKIQAELQGKLHELDSELQEIFRKAKSGNLGAEYVVMALTKVAQARGGALAVYTGKNMDLLNADMNRAQEAFSANPNAGFAEIQAMNNQTREGGFQMGRLTMDMNQITQYLQSTAENGKGFVDQIMRHREEIARAMGKL